MNIGSLSGRIVFAGTATATVLMGCGGGSGSDKDATCSQFQYFEDAQAALRNGAMQLDRDKDGIACEGLPRRPPVSTTPTIAPPVAGIYSGLGDSGNLLEGIVGSDGKIALRYVTPLNVQGVLETSSVNLQAGYKYSAVLTDYFTSTKQYSVTGTYTDSEPSVQVKVAAPYGTTLTRQKPLPITAPATGTRTGRAVILSGVATADAFSLTYSGALVGRSGSSFSGRTTFGCGFNGYVENTTASNTASYTGTAALSLTFDRTTACGFPGATFTGPIFRTSALASRLNATPVFTGIVTSSVGKLLFEVAP